MKSSHTPFALFYLLLIANLSSCFFTHETPQVQVSSLCYDLAGDCFTLSQDQYNLSNCETTTLNESNKNIRLFYPQFSETLKKPEPGYSILIGGLSFFFLKANPNPDFVHKIPVDIVIIKDIEINSNNINKFNANFWFTKKIPEANTSGIDFFELNDFCIKEQNGVLLNFPIKSNHSNFSL